MKPPKPALLAPPNAAVEELAPDLSPPVPATPPVFKPPSAKERTQALYAGPAAELLPIYEALGFIAKKLGAKVTPESTHSVFTRRTLPFASVRPVKGAHVELGLALPDSRPPLLWKKGKGPAGVERITHRVELDDVQDVNGELIRWMKRAFELCAAKPVSARSKSLGTKRPS